MSRKPATVILDSTIVGVAPEQLGAALHAGVGTVQWSAPPTCSGQVLCVRPDAPSLIGFRMMQGLGGGAMMPLMMTMVMRAAQGSDRARLMSTVALPAAIGPVLGGLVPAVGDWRRLFLINVPLCLLSLLLAWRLIPADAPSRRTPLDLVRLILLSPALVALLWGLSNTTGGLARADVLVPMIGGARLVAGFVGWALRRGGDALALWSEAAPWSPRHQRVRRRLRRRPGWS